jgi:GAF domain-containing protein
MPQILESPVNIPVDLRQKMTTLLRIAVTTEKTDKCTFQLFDEVRNILHLIAYKGFALEFLEHFREVKPFDGSSCGRAIGIGTTIVVNDVETDAAFIPHLKIIEAAGYRAVKSVPIFGNNNRKLGVFSTHFSQTKSFRNPYLLDNISKEMAHILDRIAEGLN